MTPTAQRLNARVIATAAAILLLGGFLFGFVPQFRSASGLRDELRGRDERISRLERDARLSRARDLASLMYLELTRRNYGIAAQHATAFFDHIRTMRSDSPSRVRSVLDGLISHRDAVTVDMAKSDPAAVSLVQQILGELHAVKNE